MQQSIAAVEGSSTPESQFVESGRPLLSWLRSRLVALGLYAASIPLRIVERFDSGISDSIDIDRVSARLRVPQRAGSDGKSEYPPSAEESISGTQLEIIAHFKELQRRARRRITALADSSRRLREKIDLAGIDSTLRDIPPRCENDVLRMLAEWQSRLNSFRNDVAERPQRHSREDAEDETAGQNIPAVVQFLFLAALVGSGAFLIGRTPAFELGTESLGPPVWIVVVLSVVVVLSYVTARAVSSSIDRYATFSNLRKWLRGGTGIAFVGLTSALASHYLLAMADIVDSNLSAAFGRFSLVFNGLLIERTVPLFPLDDWKVFAIVLAAGLATFVVGYQPDTEARTHAARHSPGHDRRRERTLLVKQLRKVNLKIDRAEAEVAATLKGAKAEIARYARLVDESRRLSAKANDYDYVLEDACNMLLDRYRAENSKVRSTAAPHSFQEHVCFRAEDKGRSVASADEARHLEELQQGLRKLESEAGQMRQKLRDLNSRAISTLEEALR